MRAVYEGSDISFDNEKYMLLRKMVLSTNVIFALQVGILKDASKEQLEEIDKETIAALLNLLEKEGWELVKKELSVPPSFRDGMIAKD